MAVFCLALIAPLLCLAANVHLPLIAPPDAPFISPSLISFSIESDRWSEWSGTTSRNEFLYNVMNNWKSLTGSPPHIRIGGNSEDRTYYDPDVEFSKAIFPDYTEDVPYPEALNTSVGAAWFQTAKWLPEGTHVTWGLNLGSNNTSNALVLAEHLFNAFDSQEIKDAGIVLDFVELGNEADLYKTGQRPPIYTAENYTSEWTQLALKVAEIGRISETSHLKFLIGGFAYNSHDVGLYPRGIFDEGILDSTAGAAIATFSQHRYSGSFCEGEGGLLQDLMNKATIRGNLSEFTQDIQDVRAQGLDYVLGETNSYACHGAPGVSNTAGAALWTLDYTLYATQIGISKIFYHEGIGYKYNLIQPATLTRSINDGSPLPEPLTPHVQPQYYAFIIAAEAIGNNGVTHATELSINNTDLSGYAFYEDERLVRVVLINSKAYLKQDGEDGRERTSIHVDFSFSGSTASDNVTVKRLAIRYADDLEDLLWAGQTYKTADGKAGGEPDVEILPAIDGVDIQETEVVLIQFI